MTKREEVMAAAKKAVLYVTGVPQWLEAFHAIAQLDGQRIAELEAERDNAWTELREIRAAISANPEESTLDEVVKLRQQLADLNRICEFDQKTNEQLLEQRDQLRKQVTLLRDALAECKKLNWMDRSVSCASTVDEALAATELITNTRRRNADDMGNPPANAAELLNAWKQKP